jgi:2-hydroxychromene-2-carboxylate isomerase
LLFCARLADLPHQARELQRPPVRLVRPQPPDEGRCPLPQALPAVLGYLAWCPEYARATYRAWFLENKAPGEIQNLTETLRGLGRDPEDVIPRADTREVRERYAAETDVARSMGIFGSPTFVVGDEIFWGDDRLEEALEWCVSGPH